MNSEELVRFIGLCLQRGDDGTRLRGHISQKAHEEQGTNSNLVSFKRKGQSGKLDSEVTNTKCPSPQTFEKKTLVNWCEFEMLGRVLLIEMKENRIC